MKGVLKFKPESVYYKNGEHERVLDDLVEVHYNHELSFGQRTAFESKDTGFSIANSDIESFEIVIEEVKEPAKNKPIEKLGAIVSLRTGDRYGASEEEVQDKINELIDAVNKLNEKKE